MGGSCSVLQWGLDYHFQRVREWLDSSFLGFFLGWRGHVVILDLDATGQQVEFEIVLFLRRLNSINKSGY